jgi:creatinine amidohydrolase
MSGLNRNVLDSLESTNPERAIWARDRKGLCAYELDERLDVRTLEDEMQSIGVEARVPLYTIRGPRLMVEMTWTELAETIQHAPIVLVALASTEQHGPHLPLGTDAMQAAEFLRRIVATLSAEKVLVVGGPIIPFGMAPDMAEIAMPFPGCVNLRFSTLLAVTKDVCRSLYQHGFRKMVLLHFHAENDAVAQVAAKELVEEIEDLDMLYVNWLPYMSRLFATEFDPDNPPSGHAGIGETTRMLATHPELVKLSKIPGPGAEGASSPKGKKIKFDFAPRRGGGVYRPVRNTGPLKALSYYGDPRTATSEEGERRWEAIVGWVCEVIKANFKIAE